VRKNDRAQGSVSGSARSARRREYLEFKSAVLELAEEPTPAALVRYLNASRALEGLDSLPPRPTRLVDSTNGARFALRELAMSRVDRVCST
jgi:hypothetical protein